MTGLTAPLTDDLELGRALAGLRPVWTDALARTLSAEGLGSLVAYLNGQLDYGSHWRETSRLCDCTDGGRNAPLINCPHCRGEGWVTP